MNQTAILVGGLTLWAYETQHMVMWLKVAEATSPKPCLLGHEAGLPGCLLTQLPYQSALFSTIHLKFLSSPNLPWVLCVHGGQGGGWAMRTVVPGDAVPRILPSPGPHSEVGRMYPASFSQL